MSFVKPYKKTMGSRFTAVVWYGFRMYLVIIVTGYKMFNLISMIMKQFCSADIVLM